MMHPSKMARFNKPFIKTYYPPKPKLNALNQIPDLIASLDSPLDYKSCWLYLEKQGKLLYGRRFQLYPQDTGVIAKLLVWALRDTVAARQWNIDLYKGIMLTGPVGCGKTSLMNLLRRLLPPDNRHYMKSCREAAFEFSGIGYPVITRYGRQSFIAGTELPQAICFDDLGLEPAMQYYGSPCNVMGEILLSRYDCYTSHHMLTHITTNLNSDEIERCYGRRLRSRMRELFNLVAFPGDAPDKRV